MTKYKIDSWVVVDSRDCIIHMDSCVACESIVRRLNAGGSAHPPYRVEKLDGIVEL